MDVYFRDVNWQYYPLDHADFQSQLAAWRRAPLHVFASAGPGALPPDERAFPALLFLVLANALLCVGDEAGGAFEALKYTGAMGLRDLAADYCESGEAVLGLLGRGGVSVTGVQAGLLRAMYLKTSVRIVDAVCCCLFLCRLCWAKLRGREERVLTVLVACAALCHCRRAGAGHA